MYNHTLYLTYWIVNAVTLYVANFLLSDFIVLGTWKLTPIEAAIYAGFWITFFIWIMWDFVIARGVKFRSYEGAWAYFYIINVFGIWLASRFSYIAGFGVVRFWWILLIAIGTNTLQRYFWKIITKPKKGQ